MYIYIYTHYVCIYAPTSPERRAQDVKPLEEKAISVRVEGMESFTHCDVAPGRKNSPSDSSHGGFLKWAP